MASTHTTRSPPSPPGGPARPTSPRARRPQERGPCPLRWRGERGAVGVGHIEDVGEAEPVEPCTRVIGGVGRAPEHRRPDGDAARALPHVAAHPLPRAEASDERGVGRWLMIISTLVAEYRWNRRMAPRYANQSPEVVSAATSTRSRSWAARRGSATATAGEVRTKRNRRNRLPFAHRAAARSVGRRYHAAMGNEEPERPDWTLALPTPRNCPSALSVR